MPNIEAAESAVWIIDADNAAMIQRKVTQISSEGSGDKVITTLRAFIKKDRTAGIADK